METNCNPTPDEHGLALCPVTGVKYVPALKAAKEITCNDPAKQCPHYSDCAVNSCPKAGEQYETLPDDPETVCKLTKSRKRNECKVCGATVKDIGPDAVAVTCGRCVQTAKIDGPERLRNRFQFIAWRKRRNLTQADVAKILGVSQVMVSKVESGRRPIPAWWKATL
jgi:DNA-binding XRE family transcriptional regulator